MNMQKIDKFSHNMRSMCNSFSKYKLVTLLYFEFTLLCLLLLLFHINCQGSSIAYKVIDVSSDSIIKIYILHFLEGGILTSLKFEESLLVLNEEMLLMADYRPWPRNSQPADQWSRLNLEFTYQKLVNNNLLTYHIATNKCACST
jgi:hypothetical protein